MEDSEEHTYYGLRDGADLKGYKIGLHEKRDLKQMISYFRERFESNISHSDSKSSSSKLFIKGTKPCFYSFGPKEGYNYTKGKNGVFYCYGFTGTGFKFLPLHGKIMFELIQQEDLEVNETEIWKSKI